MKEQADLAALMDSLAPLLKDKRLASSPILRGVPPKVYLKPFLDDPDDLVPFTGGVKHYQALAAVVPNLMGVPLTSEHQKVINIMHAEKLLLSREYSKAPQDTLLSIIMPTKNRAGALEGAILSIMVQSYKNWELIVINDGGDDAPQSVIAAFNDPRIIYIRLENSVGAAAARNIGLNSSRGEFIAYLDDDDQWDPDFLLICHGELVKYKRRFIYSAQMVWHGFEAESNLGKEYLLVRYVPFNRSLIENSNFISMICCMHEKSLCAEAGTFDEGLKNGEDWEFFLRLVEVTDPMQTPCILSHYYTYRYQQNVTGLQSPLLMGHRTIGQLKRRAAWHQKIAAGAKRSFEVYGLGKDLLQRRSQLPSSRAQPGVTIIVPLDDRPEKMERCLRSLAEQTSLPHELCIFGKRDPSGSGENSSGCFTMEDRTSRVDTLQEALSKALEMNVGKEEAFVVFANCNALYTPNWLEELLRLFTRFHDTGIAVPRCVLPPHNVGIPLLAPHMSRSHEADAAIHLSNVLESNIAYEGYFELEHIQLFNTFAMQAKFLREMSWQPEKVLDDEAILSLCQSTRKKGMKIYYTPFSKVYFIPSPTSVVQPGP